MFLCSASVFGVSSESMQCSYDSRGNSVPTILLLMQERLYQQGGLKVLIDLSVHLGTKLCLILASRKAYILMRP